MQLDSDVLQVVAFINVVVPRFSLAILIYCRPALEGLYTCVATQYIQERKVGEVYSQSILVETLLEAPVVVERPDSHISLCEGSPILLKIKAFGYPQPTFEWMHENEVLISEGNNTFYVRTKKILFLYWLFWL